MAMATTSPFCLDDTQARFDALKKLKDAVEKEVMDKLQTCKHPLVKHQLRFFRTCQYERKHELKDLYLQPLYSDCCDDVDCSDIAKMGKDMWKKTGDVKPEEINRIAQKSTHDFVLNPTADSQKIENFFAHHTRVFDSQKTSGQKTKYQIIQEETRYLNFVQKQCIEQ